MAKTHDKHTFLADVDVEGDFRTSKLVLAGREAGVLSVTSEGEVLSSNEAIKGLGNRVTSDSYTGGHAFIPAGNTDSDHRVKEVTAGDGITLALSNDGNAIVVGTVPDSAVSLFNIASSDVGGKDYWYEISPKGIITQGGTLEIPAISDLVSVEFPIPFTEKLFHVNINNINSDTTTWVSVLAGSRDSQSPVFQYNPSITGFTISKDNKSFLIGGTTDDQYGYITWRAVGK